MIYLLHYWGEFNKLLNANNNPLIQGRAFIHCSNFLLIKCRFVWQKCTAQKKRGKKENPDKTHPPNGI